MTVTAAWGPSTDLDNSVWPHSKAPAGPAPGVMTINPLVRTAFSGVSEGTRTPDTQDHNLVL